MCHPCPSWLQSGFERTKISPNSIYTIRRVQSEDILSYIYIFFNQWVGYSHNGCFCFLVMFWNKMTWEDVSNLIKSQVFEARGKAGNQYHLVATSQIEATLAWKHLRRMVGNEVYKWLSHYKFIFPASLVFWFFLGGREFLKNWQLIEDKISTLSIMKECQPVNMSMIILCHQKIKYIFCILTWSPAKYSQQHGDLMVRSTQNMGTNEEMTSCSEHWIQRILACTISSLKNKTKLIN